MKIVDHDKISPEQFPGGATYRTIVSGKDCGSPVLTGIQVSPPGYATPTHAHPYVEIITVLEGEAEAWSDDSEGTVRLRAGMTLVLPAKLRHGFRVVGEVPLKTYGVHASPERIVEVFDD